MGYTTLHTPQLNGIIKSRFSVIKEQTPSTLLKKLNGAAQKMLWLEAYHTCKNVRNSMANTGIMKSPFENFYLEKPNIIGLFLEFGRIVYVTKRANIRKLMKDNTYKSMMVG